MKLIKSRPVLFSVIIAVLMYVLIVAAELIPVGSSYSGVLSNFITAVPTVLMCVYLFGKDSVKFSLTGFGYGLKKGILIVLIVNILEGIAMFFAFHITQNAGFVDMPVLAAVLAVLQCVFLGIYEEFLFRGVLLNLPLSKYRGTRSQVVIVCVIESLAFGFLHCVGSLITETMTASVVLQIILKILQTGMMGFIYSALVLKIRNVWPAAAFHGIFDFCLLIAPSMLQQQASATEGYVSSSSSSSAYIYLISMAVMIPAFIHAIKMIKTLEIPCAVMGEDEFVPVGQPD